MKLLLTTDTMGGVWTYALELARALEPHGVEVALATMGRAMSDAQWAEVNRLGNVQVYASEFKLEWMHDPWADVAEAGEWLLHIAERIEPDLVHLNTYAHGALPRRVPALVVGHSCVLSWWEAVKGEPAPPDWGRYRKEVTRGLQAASAVVAPSRAMVAALQQHYGPLSGARVIPNGREPAGFPPGRKELFVLSAGRLWDEAKNLRVLDTIAGRIEWPVYVAGEERHPDGWQIGSDSVHPLGSLAPPVFAEWLSRASIYALPARYEPFGLSILEAALAGCALVIGDIPSLREIWDGAALFVQPDNLEALEAALHTLIRDPTHRTALATRARTRALQYTPQRMGDTYLALYRELLRPYSSSGAEPRNAVPAGNCESAKGRENAKEINPRDTEDTEGRDRGPKAGRRYRTTSWTRAPFRPRALRAPCRVLCASGVPSISRFRRLSRFRSSLRSLFGFSIGPGGTP